MAKHQFILFLTFFCLLGLIQPVLAQNLKPTEKIQIAFVGDIILHKDLYKKVVSSSSKDFSEIWKRTIPHLEKSDITYANLEGPTAEGLDSHLKLHSDSDFIYDDKIYSGDNFLFNYHPNLIDSLLKSGIDIVSTANNHALDRGSKGIDMTIDALTKRNLAYVGTRLSKNKDSTVNTDFIKIIEKNDFKIAWIACSEALNGFTDKKNQLLLCFEQKDQILNLIRQTTTDKTADIIIILPHWGTEYSHTPTDKQKKWAYEILNTGATAIIGSHPHVLQPVEVFTTKDQRKTFIAYSLGNFVAYQRSIDRKSSAIIYLDFIKNEKGTAISQYSYLPTTRAHQDIFPVQDILNSPRAFRKDVNKKMAHDIFEHVDKYLKLQPDLFDSTR